MVGTALGVAGSLLRDKDPADTTTDDGGVPAADPEASDKPVDTDKKPDIADPALAFEITDFRDLDGKIVAAWQDPSDGEASFILSQTTPERDPVQAFDFGQTEAEIPFQFGPGRSCFVMVVRMPAGTSGRKGRALPATGG